MAENILLNGKVIEILEKKGIKMARITCSTCFINISIKESPDIRLNDKITIDAQLVIDKISHDLSVNNGQNFELN